MSVKLAIIGGTGVYDPEMLVDTEKMQVETRYGLARLTRGIYQGQEILFLTRHGSEHSTPPHKINYRANIAALVKLGARRVIATAAVGSLNLDMRPGAMVLLGQFLDFTKGRESTFFDGGETGVIHTDFTEPYCPDLNQSINDAAQKVGIEIVEGATYVCTEGPRFENPAEIRMFKMMGGDLVGMTNVPEAVLAREAGLCYSTLALCTNFAAGISPGILTHQEVLAVMDDNLSRVRSLLAQVIAQLKENRNCRCRELGSPILL